MGLFSHEKEILEEEYVCYECGAEMQKADDEVLVCLECGHSVDIEDYSSEEETYEDVFGGQNNIHCVGCDGPWPTCTTTCRLYNRG